MSRPGIAVYAQPLGIWLAIRREPRRHRAAPEGTIKRRPLPGTIGFRYRFAVSPKTVNSATPGVMPFGAPSMTSRAALPGVGGHSR